MFVRRSLGHYISLFEKAVAMATAHSGSPHAGSKLDPARIISLANFNGIKSAILFHHPLASVQDSPQRCGDSLEDALIPVSIPIR